MSIPGVNQFEYYFMAGNTPKASENEIKEEFEKLHLDIEKTMSINDRYFGKLLGKSVTSILTPMYVFDGKKSALMKEWTVEQVSYFFRHFEFQNEQEAPKSLEKFALTCTKEVIDGAVLITLTKDDLSLFLIDPTGQDILISLIERINRLSKSVLTPLSSGFQNPKNAICSKPNTVLTGDSVIKYQAENGQDFPRSNCLTGDVKVDDTKLDTTNEALDFSKQRMVETELSKKHNLDCQNPPVKRRKKIEAEHRVKLVKIFKLSCNHLRNFCQFFIDNDEQFVNAIFENESKAKFKAKEWKEYFEFVKGQIFAGNIEHFGSLQIRKVLEEIPRRISNFDAQFFLQPTNRKNTGDFPEPSFARKIRIWIKDLFEPKKLQNLSKIHNDLRSIFEACFNITQLTIKFAQTNNIELLDNLNNLIEIDVNKMFSNHFIANHSNFIEEHSPADLLAISEVLLSLKDKPVVLPLSVSVPLRQETEESISKEIYRHVASTTSDKLKRCCDKFLTLQNNSVYLKINQNEWVEYFNFVKNNIDFKPKIIKGFELREVPSSIYKLKHIHYLESVFFLCPTKFHEKLKASSIEIKSTSKKVRKFILNLGLFEHQAHLSELTNLFKLSFKISSLTVQFFKTRDLALQAELDNLEV